MQPANDKVGNNGFTLLEMVITLILAGVLMAIAGMGLVMGVQGFIFARENTVTSQKVQLSFARMDREFSSLTRIDQNLFDSPSPSMLYENISGKNVIVWKENSLRLCNTDVPDACTQTLLDRVNSADISLKQKDDSDWTTAMDIDLLHRISVQIILARTGPGRSTITFNHDIFPRRP